MLSKYLFNAYRRITIVFYTNSQIMAARDKKQITTNMFLDRSI